MKKYAVWNNKGGVGKTYLTFVIATEYALRNPEQQVVVIDMCPQANVSEILLGGNGIGSENLDKILKENPRKSIGGYFDHRLSSPDRKTGTEGNFWISVKEYAKELPSNLHLVCGDPSLELQVQSINQLASIDLPEDRWKNVHSWVIDLQDAISTHFNGKVVFFVDCNPSFATYTAQAILASSRLIVPCTADGSSARALDNIAQLLFGIGTPAAYQKTNFSTRAKNGNIRLPNIHLILLNRATINDNQPASAFRAMYSNIKNKACQLMTQNRNIFTPGLDPFIDIPDAHTVAVISSHFAKPLRNIKPQTYKLADGTTTMVNKSPLERYVKALNQLIDFI
jgi:cellulose biosynthesis protein BcsQ